MIGPTSSWPQGYGLARFDEIDSTNEEARRMAAAGETGPVWITAARQTSGRGRRGRVWQSPTGNLAATLLMTPGAPQAEWAQLSFAAAIATADMLQAFAPAAAIAVKWPNDILAEDRKLAGILLERVGEGLAIGIGVNLRHFPDDTEFPATSLSAFLAEPPTPDAALAGIAHHFAHWHARWQGDGFGALREAWLARAAGLGATIRARLPHETRSGVFEGIDAGGALLLNEGQGRVRAIQAGEIFFGSASGTA